LGRVLAQALELARALALRRQWALPGA